MPSPHTESENHFMKKYLTYLLAGALMLAATSLPASAKQGDTQATTLEKVKIKIAKLGVGEKAKATIFLKDGGKKKGYIAQAGDDDFILRDRKTDAPATIRYEDVIKVDNNRGHSMARNLGIGVAIGVGAAILGTFLIVASLDD
jgi:hypothetical protein